MSQKILAMARPKVIDLTQFTDENTGMTINDLALGLMMESLQNNGAMQTLQTKDKNLALRTALATNRQVVVQSQTPDGVKTKFPVAYAHLDRTTAQIAFSAMVLSGVVVELKACFVYTANLTDGALSLYVKATPVS